MLSIKDLHITVDSREIVKGVSLDILPGEIHVIMGPNGSGKSTLAQTIAGHPRYSITSGTIMLDGEELNALKPDKRSHRGVFLAFQYPKEIPGVSVSQFMRTALAATRKARGLKPLPPTEFRKSLRTTMAELGLASGFMNRAINEGFSGGEKKKIEMVQLLMLEPRLAILDEADSGLDVDALKAVSMGINRFIDGTRSLLIITHYQRILHYVQPHKVHVMVDGNIVTSGGPELSRELEKEGYARWTAALPA